MEPIETNRRRRKSDKLIVFLGNVIHSGGEYSEDTYRFHFYLMSESDKYDVKSQQICFFEDPSCIRCGDTLRWKRTT